MLKNASFMKCEKQIVATLSQQLRAWFRHQFFKKTWQKQYMAYLRKNLSARLLILMGYNFG